MMINLKNNNTNSSTISTGAGAERTHLTTRTTNTVMVGNNSNHANETITEADRFVARAKEALKHGERGGAGGAGDEPTSHKFSSVGGTIGFGCHGSIFVGRETELTCLERRVDRLLCGLGADGTTTTTAAATSTATNNASVDDDISRQPSRVFSIYGAAGTGKSCFVDQLRSRVREHDNSNNSTKSLFFVKGKFDQKQMSQGGGGAYTGLATAMKELTDQIVGRDFDMSIRRRICEIIDDPDDASVLIEIFPSLSKILSSAVKTQDKNRDSEDEQKAHQMAKRRQFLFQQLIRAVLFSKAYKDEDILGDNDERGEDDDNVVQSTTGQAAIVMVLDDVQWIDKPSLNLVSSLVRDIDLEGSFLLITTSRLLLGQDNSHGHPFVKELKCWESHNTIIESLQLGNLGSFYIRTIVASLLDSEEQDTSPLADIIYKKTLGNPYFSIELLKAFVDQNILTYSYGDLKWKWDSRTLQSRAIAIAEENATVTDIVKTRLYRLSYEQQLVLFIAACHGVSCNEQLIKNVIQTVGWREILGQTTARHHQTPAVNSTLGILVDSGFLDRSGDNYYFRHDLIKEVTMNFVPKDRSNLLRLRVGECILKGINRGSGDNADTLLFLGVDLCNGATALLSQTMEPNELANYNALAAEKAMRESAFTLSLCYTKAGISFLESNDSSHERPAQLYENLLAGAAEASYCTGDFQAVGAYADRLLGRLCTEDLQLKMLYFKILSAAAMKRNEEAVDFGLVAFGVLGMGKFPKNPGVLSVIKELTRTKWALRNHTRETLQNLPILTDKKRITAMQFIDVLTSATFIFNPKIYRILFLRSVRWSMKYGISKYSPMGFANYGMIVCSTGDISGGSMYGDVALALCNRLGIKESNARTSMSVFGAVHHWTSNMRSCYPPIMYAHKLSMECGDAETAVVCLKYMDQVAWCSSLLTLKTLARDLQRHCALCREYKHAVMFNGLMYLAKGLRRLCNRDEDAFAWLDAPVFSETIFDSSAAEIRQRDPPNKALTDAISLQANYLLGEWEEALERANRSDGTGIKTVPGQPFVPHTHFYRALVFLSFASRGKCTRQNLRKAKNVLQMMRKWVCGGNVNCQHMVSLIEAEVAKIKNQNNKATELYSKAIHLATRTGHIHDAGVCHECTADFYLQNNDRFKASRHVKQALNCFREWGADAKAQQLIEKYSGDLDLTNVDASTISFYLSRQC